MTVMWLTSLRLDTEKGLVVHEHWEVRVPNRVGASAAPTERSALHRIADPCVA
ncbi:hypothetical protein [Streptomyces spirodelae]|uniref:Uncharacterized protein n=1 Tax=Streptomyces spirodelae TaxID=2812904 RepID=A0ABS3WQ59_9ACTN|nr:hypothetical protein [Streptomyces spirodelae]MBO8185031.1 hypothetical protein [Streptomyces spirodelae]